MRKCRICFSTALEKILSLGDQPLVNKYVKKYEDTARYPLELFRCTNCELLQLGYVVPPEILFPEDYPYIPSVSKTNLKHFETIAKELVTELKLNKKSLVIDIGSNDGSLLKAFKKKGTKVLGVEPAANLAILANNNKIPTVSAFISPMVARSLVDQVGKAKLVTMTNVMAHVDDLHAVLESLDILLDEDGVFFAQFPDAKNLLKENQFDTIYHEHLSYFTLESLNYLFAHSPFEIYKMDSSSLHGGSMKIEVRRRISPFGSFIRNTELIKHEMYEYLSKEKKKGKKIVGFGAAAKGVILLNYCNLDNTIIDYVADGTPYKQGKYIPGVYIPIVPEETLKSDPPDIVVILAWNFKEEIMEKLKGRGYTFVIPIPKMEVVK